MSKKSIVIVGGGFGGVTLARRLERTLPDNRDIFLLSKSNLVTYSPLLPEVVGASVLPGHVVVPLRRILKRTRMRMVTVTDIDTNSRLVHYSAPQKGAIVVCTVGNRPQAFVTGLALSDCHGVLATNMYMQLESEKNIWAMGDCARVPSGVEDNAICPPTAQCAIRQASKLADNLLRSIRAESLEPFRYRATGQLAAICGRKAVAEAFGFRLSGSVAWLLWRGFYLSKIPTLARKARLFLEWNWAIFFPKDVALLDFERSSY